MKSVFARVLKVAAPYTLCCALGVVALAGEARAQIAPECLDPQLDAYIRYRKVDVVKMTVPAIPRLQLPAWVTDAWSGKEIDISLQGGNRAREFGLGAQIYDFVPRAYPEDYNGYQIVKGHELHNLMDSVKKCSVTRDSKGIYKSLTVAYGDPKEVGTPSGNFTLTLRPPALDKDKVLSKYEVANVKFSAGKAGSRDEGGLPTASGTVSIPPGRSTPTDAGEFGYLIAQTDLIRAQFTDTELTLLKNLKNYVAELAKKELDKTNAPHYIFVKDHFKQLAHQKKFVDRIPSDGTEDNRIDAVYHVGMQAYLTITTGIVNAKDLGDLWELKDLPGSFLNGVWMIPSGTQYNFYLASNKDFHNNRVGRNLGSQLLKKWPSQPASTPAQRQALAEKCIDEALKLVLKAPATWKKGQTSGIVIGEGDPNVPAYTDPSKPHVTVVLKLWRLTSSMSDNVLHPFFRQLRRLFGLPS